MHLKSGSICDQNMRLRCLDKSVCVAGYFVCRKAALEMPELGFVSWNRLGQGGYERRKQVNAFDTYAHFLGKFACERFCVLATQADYSDSVC